MTKTLSTLDLHTKKYFVDHRLNQIRNVDNPHEYYDFSAHLMKALESEGGYLVTGLPAIVLLNKLLCTPNFGEGYGSLEERKAGVYFDPSANRYVAFDNTAGQCYVEEFQTLDKAIRWASGEEGIETVG